MLKCYLYYSFISSVIFVSACLECLCMYGNIQGGIWAGVAALVSGLYFYLNKLYFSGSLQYYFRAETMDRFNILAFVIVLISCTFWLWYIFILFYWSIPIKDYARTPIFPCVFSSITGKWGFHLYTSSAEYKKFLFSNYSPLIQSI